MPERHVAISAIAEAQYGVFSYAQAIAAGFSRAAISRRVSNGTWRRLHQEVFAIAGAPLTFRSRIMAATLAVGDAVASHRTAARLYELDGFLTDRRVEVLIFDRRGMKLPGSVVHRPRLWLDEDRSSVGPIPATSPARTLFDLAAVCRKRQVEIAFDDALRRDLVTVEAMTARLEMVRRPGVRGLRLIGQLIRDRSVHPVEESELEAMFRRLVAAHGLPAPVPQYEIRRPDGSFVARVDFAYPGARLAIELDSWAYHGGRTAFEEDRVRQNELVALGWTPLRFTKSDLASRGHRVATLVARHIAPAARMAAMRPDTVE